MSNRLALALVLSILVALVADFALNGGAAVLFLLRRLVQAVAWLAFWQ